MNWKEKFPYASKTFIELNANGKQEGYPNLVHNQRDPAKWIQFKCKTCGKSVERYKSNRNKNEFCSVECVHRDPGVSRKRSEAVIASRKGANAYSRAAHGWRIINGKRFHFRSRMEANYARYMSFMGVSWEYEPKTFWFTNIKRGVRSYTPDFYLPDVDKYIECKGWMDKRSATKLKRMKKYFPEINLEVIDYKRFKSIAKIARNIVPEWEIDPSSLLPHRKGAKIPSTSESSGNNTKSSTTQTKD